MFSIRLILLIAFNICYSISAEKISYENYHLISINPSTASQLAQIDQWEHNFDFDVWHRGHGLNTTIHVLLSPLALKSYANEMKSRSMDFHVIHENIQSIIDEQELSIQTSKKDLERSDIVGKYASYSEIIAYISQVVTSNPDLAYSYVAGKTFQLRNLQVLVLKTQFSRKAIWLDCGIHSREWISTSSCIYFISKLISDYRSNDPTVRSLLSKYEFHILPMVNPDGYDYTWNTDRMWRKNRSPNQGTSCVGTDLNRNFDNRWGTVGTSPNPCAETYPGKGPFDQLETQAIRNAFLARPGLFEIYMTIHSYGQMWFLPYAGTTTEPLDFAKLYATGKVGRDALTSVYGTPYLLGTPAQILYAAAGGSFDWTKDTAGVAHSYAMELRPGQTGLDSFYGFILPDSRINAVGQETYVGLIAMFSHIQMNG